MNISGLLKKFKKHLRWKKRWLTLGILLLVPTALLWSISWFNQQESVVPASTTTLTWFSEGDHPFEQYDKNVYFGISENKSLSLFEGPPSDKKVIRSFFQLDIEYLESSIPREMLDQLYQGIQVSDFAEYNSVLSTFSDYAIDISDEVMKQIR